MQTSEAKPIRQSCQFCSLKAEQFYFFYVPGIQELEVFSFFIHSEIAMIPAYEFCCLFDSWVCLFPLQHLATRWH